MSRIRTNLITNRMANGAPTVSNGLVISGVTTTTTLDVNGDLDVDGHLNADNVSIAGVVTATTFSGSGASLPNLPVPTTITVADESTDTTCNPLFVTTTSGNLAPKTGTNLTFNSASGNLRAGSLFVGTATNESKTQDGLILERNSADGEAHITAGRSGGNYSGMQFYVAGASGVTKRHLIDYQSNFRWYGADGTTERVRLTSGGNFGINTTSPSDKLHVNGGDIIISTTNAPNLRLVKADNSSGNSTLNAFFGLATANNNFFNGAVDNDLCIVAPTNGRIHFGFANSIKLRMENDGTLFSAATYNNTTASGSRAVVMPNNTGEFFASTSSRRFKTNITTLTDALADKILECRPVSFNSTCDVDNKSKIFYGLIAEEVHEIDTSLVAYEDENAETPVPAGVQYDRFVPHLINLVKRQKAQIEALETRIAALEGS